MVTGRSIGRRTGGGMPGNEHVLLQQEYFLQHSMDRTG